MRSPARIGALGVLAVYVLTMSRDMALFDSPELALVAYELGLGHPPGQPLHTVLGHLFTHLPGMPPLIGLNFMSALCGALTVLPATRIAQRLLVARRSNDDQAFHGPSLRASWALVGVIVIAALHPVLWEPATRIEVYSLATLLSVWSLERIQAALTSSGSPTRVHPLIMGALLAGLAASANPVVALMCVIAVTPALMIACVRRRIPWRVLALAVMAGVLGLLPYAYVVIVAGRTDAFIWGAPTDSSTLFDYLRGNDYRHNAGISFDQWIEHLTAWCAESMSRFGATWLLFGVVANVALGRPDRGLGRLTSALLLVLSVGLVCANAIFRIDNPDYHGYLAAPFWLCAAGVAALLARTIDRGRSRWHVPVIVVGIAVSVSLMTPPLWKRSRADEHIARELVEPALRATPPNAVVIVESDHWIASAWYLQRVERLRPDVVVLSAGLASSGWYWDTLYRQHPSLQPFALRGPGGRTARVQRFVAAQARPVRVEQVVAAHALGLTVCVDGTLFSVSPCVQDIARAHRDAAGLAQQLQQLGDVAPLSTELLAMWSLQRGEELWRAGAAGAALHTLLAGVPASMRSGVAIDWRALATTPTLQRPPITWRREVVLGEPARNLYVAAELLFVAGQRDASQQLAVHAARLGLPEAVTGSAP